jgi:arsenate reductase-like glutaredoxin family protein
MGIPRQAVFRRNCVGVSLRRDNEQEHLLITIYHNPRCRKSRTALIAAMVENPILIERPIVVNGEKVTLDRPAEILLGIL